MLLSREVSIPPSIAAKALTRSSLGFYSFCFYSLADCKGHRFSNLRMVGQALVPRFPRQPFVGSVNR